jgi:hypothetical protein
MQGKVVRVTGVLHFSHFESKTNDTVEAPQDYFYFDAETAKINESFRQCLFRVFAYFAGHSAFRTQNGNPIENCIVPVGSFGRGLIL